MWQRTDENVVVAMLFILVLYNLWFNPVYAMPRTIGPEYQARPDQHLRDLPIAKVLSGMTRVAPKTKNKTMIEMSLSVNSIDMDLSKGVFKTDGYIALTWNDPRYAWNPLDHDGVTRLRLPFSSTWAPEIILDNAEEEKFIYRQVGHVHDSGNFVYLVKIHAKSRCRPGYEDANFPFHLQICSLRFGSWLNEQYGVEYRATNETDVNLSDFTSPTGWEIVASEARLESVHYPKFEEPSRLVVFTFAFKRNLYYDSVSGILWKVLFIIHFADDLDNEFSCCRMKEIER